MELSLSERDLLKEKTEYTGVHPQKFALWIAMGSMTMFFAAITSALLIKKGDFRVWENFRLPNIFMYSTFVIISVSILMHASLISYRKARFSLFRTLLAISFLMACLFLGLQVEGWHILKGMGYATNRKSGRAHLFTCLPLCTAFILLAVWRLL